MNAARPDDHENVDALERLNQATPRDPLPPAPTDSATEDAENADPFPAVTDRPATSDAWLTRGPSQPAPDSPTTANIDPTRYRCLECGYPLPNVRKPRCPECGRRFDRKALAHWYSGAEQAIIDRVIWLCATSLFLRLLVMPDFAGLSQIGSAIVCVLATWQLLTTRAGTLGGYFATAAAIAALASLGLYFRPTLLPHYTFDITAGCLLLLAVLHAPTGGTVAGQSGTRVLALLMLFATPLFAVACVQLTTSIPVPPLLNTYPLWTFVVPATVAFVIWGFCLWTCVTIRRTLFRGEPE